MQPSTRRDCRKKREYECRSQQQRHRAQRPGCTGITVKRKNALLKAAPHKIIHPEPNSTRPIPTQLDEQPERLAARRSAAKTVEIIEASLQPLDTVQAMESDNSWRGSDLEQNLQHFMKRQLQRSQTATQALSHIQQARPALYEAHFKEWHTLWERFEHLPELRTAYDKLMLPPNRHDPNRETEPSETELAARLLKLMDAGELDTPANISTQGAVTHIINTLTDDHFATQLKQQSKVSKLLLPFITETLSELQSDTPNIDVKALRKLQSYLGHLCKAIQTKLPQKTMSHSEKQTLLREIDALQKRLTLCQETVALKQALGTPSLSETFSRIYTLRPYHTSLESVGYILGPITEQQEALNSWQSQIEPMANGSDDASELDCTLQWLKGTLLELSTQQACEQAEKTNRQITTLDAIQAVKKGAQASNNIAHTASENRSSAAAAQDLSQLLQPHEIIVNGQNEQGEITDRLAATIETPEGTLSIFDAALWGYLDKHYPGELSGEESNLELLKGTHIYEQAVARKAALEGARPLTPATTFDILKWATWGYSHPLQTPYPTPRGLKKRARSLQARYPLLAGLLYLYMLPVKMSSLTAALKRWPTGSVTVVARWRVY